MDEGDIMKYMIPKLETMSDKYLAVCGNGSHAGATGTPTRSCGDGGGTEPNVCQIGDSGCFQCSNGSNGNTPCIGGSYDQHRGIYHACDDGTAESIGGCLAGPWDGNNNKCIAGISAF